MPNYIVAPLDALVDRLESLPGIGHKTAQRLAYHILNMPEKDAKAFSEAIINAHEKIHYCKDCCNLTDGDLCPVCRSDRRDRTLICVVEEPKDVFALERAGDYALFNCAELKTLERAGDYPGLYHVLHGAISPLAGVGPDQLKIKELLARIGTGVQEVIMATNPTVEGDATALYVARLLKPLGVRVTRLAYGIPVGGDLEYADNVTLQRALEGRRDL